MTAGRDAKADWERCRGYIEAALEYTGGTHTIEDVEEGIARGELHFWPGKRCAVVTEVVDYPRMRVLNLFLCGGDLDELKAMQPCFLSFAEFLGCRKLTLGGRLGWERALKSLGWQRHFVVLTLEVEGRSN